MQRIAIVGAGIAGLTVAQRRAAAGDRVVVFEASARVGGQLWSEAREGFLIEHGAEGFVAGSQAVPRIAEEVDLAEDLVEQQEQRSFCFDGNGLVELAPGDAARLLGFQVPSGELGRGIRSFRRGMGELPERIALRLAGRVELHLQSPIRNVAPCVRGVAVTDAHGAIEDFDIAVIATTAPSAAQLLGDAFGQPALALSKSVLLSSITVTLAFDHGAVTTPLEGTGFIVPRPEELESLRAASFSSSKLPYRAPSGCALIRLFFRPTERDRLDLSDAAWSERAERVLGRALRVRGPARHVVVSRWPLALPVFDDAHRARIHALETVLGPAHIWLAGAAFHGSGIDAAVRSALACADAISRAN